MNERLKSVLIKKILRSIPANVKPVGYLTDVLDLGRESVYRRLSGQIDFSLTEVVTLSSKLNFSLDEIHCECSDIQSSFGFQNDLEISPEKSFLRMLQFHYESMLKASQASQSRVSIAMNRMLGILSLRYPNLLKLSYYKWIHQFEKVSLNYYYSDLEVPQEIIRLAQQASFYDQQLDKIIILDENIHSTIVQDVNYYRDRGLINDDELKLIKEDLSELFQRLRVILRTGYTTADARWEVYLSSINIASNTIYMQYDDEELVSFLIHSDDAIHTSDSKVCQLQREWIETVKKFSTLISNSNEKVQTEFINLQYKCLDELI